MRNWFQKFRCGVENFENEPRGRPSRVLEEQILQQLVESNVHINTQELAQELAVYHATVV